MQKIAVKSDEKRLNLATCSHIGGAAIYENKQWGHVKDCDSYSNLRVLVTLQLKVLF